MLSTMFSVYVIEHDPDRLFLTIGNVFFNDMGTNKEKKDVRSTDNAVIIIRLCA